MNMWRVTAHFVVRNGPWHYVDQCPTFFLDPDLQGFTTLDQAVEVALTVLGRRQEACSLHVLVHDPEGHALHRDVYWES
jgi:hypothetical protein